MLTTIEFNDIPSSIGQSLIVSEVENVEIHFPFFNALLNVKKHARAE